MGKPNSASIHERTMLRIQIEDHQPSRDLIDLAMETADPRITEGNIAVRVSANSCRQMLQTNCGSAVLFRQLILRQAHVSKDSLGRNRASETQQRGHPHLGGNCCSGPVNYLSLIYNPDDARKTGNRLLGKLFLVIAGQAASQVEYAPLVAIAGETSNAEVGSVPKSLPGCFCEFGKESTFRRGRGNHWLHTDSL